MKKKILISTVVVIMILSMALMIFAGCDKFKSTPLKDFKIPTAYIGATMATDDMFYEAPEAINESMSAMEMLNKGMKNFYNAKYAVIEYNGGVNMTLAGSIKVNQVVQSTKIREGKGDAAGQNANGATYFADNKSHSQFAKIYEKFYITPDSFTRKSGNNKNIEYDKKSGRLGSWKVTAWNKTNKYDSLDQLVTKNSNNPTILWMYDLKEEYIKGKFDPVYDDETKTYRFALKFDPKKSTVEYRKVMNVQLKTNAGMDVKNLEFLELVLQVVMWENGTIRSISVTEQYQMKMMLPGNVPLDSKVKLTATQLFSYDPNENGYVIAEHIEKFNNNKV